MSLSGSYGELADDLAAAVREGCRAECRQGEAEVLLGERGERGTERARRAALGFERDADGWVGAAGAEEAFGTALREPAVLGLRLHEQDVRTVGAADELRVSAHRSCDACSSVEVREARERERHA